MTTKESTRSPSRLRSAVAAAALLGFTGAASAEPVSLSLDYTCPFPLIGDQTITAEINSDMPAEVTAPADLGPFNIDATTTVPADAVTGLGVVGAETIEGTAVNQSTVETPVRDLSQTVNLTIPSSTFPDEPQAFTVPASGETSVVTVEAQDAGEGRIVVGGLTLDMTARLADGSIAPAPVGQFTSDCTQVAGQNNVLHTFTVVEETPPGEISVEPTAVDFGEVTMATTTGETVTVSNDGDGPLTINGVSVGGADASVFTQSNDCGALAAGESCSVEVTFAPQNVAAYSGSLTIESDADNEQTTTVDLSGNGTDVLEPVIDVSPSEVDFGGVQNGTSADETVTVSNSGNEGLGITSISIGGTDAGAFTQTNDCASSVDPGASCTVRVTYMPSGEETQSASLSIESTDEDNSPLDVSLTGDPEVAPTGELSVSPDSVDFGSVNLGESASQEVTVSNTGDAGFNVTAVNLDGANVGDFMQSNDCSTLGADSSCTVTVTFTPSAEGARNASLTVDSDLEDNASANVSLAGTGNDPNGGGGETIETAFDLEGGTFIKAADSSLPLTGTIDATLELATGMFTADLNLDPTRGSFKAFGFVNAKAKVAFEPVGETTGTLDSGILSADSQVYVKVPKVTARLFFFRIPIGGGSDCKTMDPVNLSLSTPEGESFGPASGGPVSGTYSVPALENCGPLTGLLNQFLSGPGNTIDLTLSAQEDGSDSDGESDDQEEAKSRFSRWWHR